MPPHAREHRCLDPVLTIVSLLSSKNPFILPLEKKGQCAYGLGLGLADPLYAFVMYDVSGWPRRTTTYVHTHHLWQTPPTAPSCTWRGRRPRTTGCVRAWVSTEGKVKSERGGWEVGFTDGISYIHAMIVIRRCWRRTRGGRRRSSMGRGATTAGATSSPPPPCAWYVAVGWNWERKDGRMG
jgi:hypothetical protein